MFGLVLGGRTLSLFETEERFGGYPGLRIEKFLIRLARYSIGEENDNEGNYRNPGVML